MSIVGAVFRTFIMCLLCGSGLLAQGLHWQAVKPDLVVPEVIEGRVAAGKRVRHRFKEFQGTRLYHAIYLPTDWHAGKSYPVIIEYAGNRHRHGDGSVESCKLGYGITGGKGAIWVSMPFVDLDKKANSPTWWGSADATVDYCKQAVRQVCTQMGGDPSRVFIAGFSRGSIAANYIGLHDDEIAKLWCGFICHSHYEGVRKWGWKDKESAADRLKRLGKRPQYVSQEKSVNATREYLRKADVDGAFTFVSLPFAEHTDRWVLRDIPPREQLRDWFLAVNTSVSWQRDRRIEDFEVLRNRIQKGAGIRELEVFLGEPHAVTQDNGAEYYEYHAKDQAGRSIAWSATIDSNGRLLEWSGPTDP